MPLSERLALLVFPEYKAYETPVFFKSDWLNEYWDQCSEMEDDYRFVYIGPKGSWTPFHADVFRSYSWSANICGCKKWIIYPPGQEQYLHDTLGNLIYDVTSIEIANNKKYPKIDHIQKPIVVIQKEGEVLFVPSGWHHQVHNMEDTITINHNWTNACGLFKMWNHLQSELNQVQRSIQDCNDMENWHQHCQLMLKAMSGMDYEGFVSFLVKIAQPRCDVIATNNSTSGTEEWTDVFQDWKKTLKQVESKEEFNVKDYCIFDLATIHKCVAMVANDESLQKLQNAGINSKIDGLLSQIMNVLGDDEEMWGPLASLRFEDKSK